MSRRTSFFVAGGILVGAIVVAVLLVNLRSGPPQTPPGSTLPTVGTVAAETVEGALTVRGSGTVRPRAEVELAPQVGGRVEWVSASLVSGGRVQADELLLRIEDADYRNAVQQARAQVAQDQVAVLQAEEEARIARQEYEQFVERRSRDGVGEDSVAAQASGLVFREPQLEAARAALERSRAQLADAELALSRTEVRAPFDGVVRTESVDPGAFRAAGQTVATLYASDEVEVVLPLTDQAASLLPGLWSLRADDGDQGLPARATALFGRERFAWDGYVHRAETALDESSRTVDVVVRVPEPFRAGEPVSGTPTEDAPPLLVGQFVDVEVEGRSGVWTRLPRRALRPGDEVWVVEDGTLSIVPVRVVQRSQSDIYVVGEIADGAWVVTEGIQVATDGMRVERRAAAAAAATPADSAETSSEDPEAGTDR